MKLSKFFILLVVSTMAAIFYVTQQVEATKIGYQINAQQLALSDTLDQRQMLLYNVYNLKSPENLQESFYKKSKKPEDFKILNKNHIIVLANSNQKQRPQASDSVTSKLGNILGINSLAEAKTQE